MMAITNVAYYLGFRTIFGRFRTVFERFRMVSDRFRTVSDGFGRFRIVFGTFRIVFGPFRIVFGPLTTTLFLVLNFQISIGQGWGTAVADRRSDPSGPTAVPRPAPALAN